MENPFKKYYGLSDRRMAICVECDRYREGRCLECGCFMAYKTKIPSSKCPLDKWCPEEV